MLDKTNLLALMKIVAKADSNAPVSYSYAGENFSYEQLNETLRKELNEYAGTYALYRENKNMIFELIEQTIDEILPKKVAAQYDQFAETKVFAQGDKPIFRRRINTRTRAKQFITRVGLAGKYEVFKLSKTQESFEVQTSAIGGAAQIGFEEFLDGRVDFAEVVAIVMEGMDDLIYEEIGQALQGAVNQLPPANRYAFNGFNEAAFDKLLMVAGAYGTPTIYCTQEFAVKMVPKDAWRYTEEMKTQLWKTGRLADYKGYRVIILEQGFKDPTNTTKAIDPGFCWIIPTGADTKPVKVAFEGDTLVDEFANHDWSRDIQVYKKVGVVCMMANNICCYVDTSLLGELETWKLDNYDIIRDYTGQIPAHGGDDEETPASGGDSGASTNPQNP